MKMKKLLITAFEPFGGETLNPSQEAVFRISDVVGVYSIERLLLPVEFETAVERVIAHSEVICPDVIISVGQAGGREKITPELVGINLRHAKIPDNAGNIPTDEPILENGNAAYFSTLPVRKMAQAIDDAGIPAQVSYSAGAYVCNEVFYSLLSHFSGTDTRVGFIHIPYSAEQNKHPSMELSDIVRALEIAIQSIDK